MALPWGERPVNVIDSAKPQAVVQKRKNSETTALLANSFIQLSFRFGSQTQCIPAHPNCKQSDAVSQGEFAQLQRSVMLRGVLLLFRGALGLFPVMSL